MCVCVCVRVRVRVRVPIIFNPQEHFQLEGPLFKPNEIVILELACSRTYVSL